MSYLSWLLEKLFEEVIYDSEDVPEILQILYNMAKEKDMQVILRGLLLLCEYNMPRRDPAKFKQLVVSLVILFDNKINVNTPNLTVQIMERNKQLLKDELAKISIKWS